MPTPTDKVRVNRTFRKCASDQLGVCYHSQAFAIECGTVYLQLLRGKEAIECELSFPSSKSLKHAMSTGPLLHGGINRSSSMSLHWSYDKFGDCVFSSLKSGSYRDAQAKEWSTQEVLDDCVDEVRRMVWPDSIVEASPARKATPVAGTPINAVRRIIR